MIDPAIDRCLSPISVWGAAIKLEAAAELPRHHGDPFDRVLIAHALQDDLSVLTRDDAFGDYGVRLAL